MPLASTKLYDLVYPADHDATLREVRHIADLMDIQGTMDTLDAVHGDVVRLFAGDAPGYRASNTAYHDLEHTLSVVLAAARLLHGCSLAEGSCDPHLFVLGMVAAYFHDTGLIQSTDDRTGTGAKHTVGHEDRSISVMERFAAARGLTPQDRADVADMILCTELGRDPSRIAFRTAGTAHAGYIVGTADLLAQIADRRYLEKLPGLFREFAEAGLPGFDSELDLLHKTSSFYEHVALPRMQGPLGGMDRYMVNHFRVRWNIADDLYAVSIQRNLDHLETALEKCPDSYDCLLDYLRRDPAGQDG